MIVITSDLHYGFDGSNHNKIYRFISKRLKSLCRLPDNEALVIAGDLVSHRPSQMKPLLTLLRQHIACPIGVVLGNHDRWSIKGNDPGMPEDQIVTLYRSLFREYDTTYLSFDDLITNNYNIVGWDGWYRVPTAMTNDPCRICFSDQNLFNDTQKMKYMCDKNDAAFTSFLSRRRLDDNKFNIVTTHFNFRGSPIYDYHRANPVMLDLVADDYELVITGHSHHFDDYIYKNTRVVTCGSDYNKPQALVYDPVNQTIDVY